MCTWANFFAKLKSDLADYDSMDSKQETALQRTWPIWSNWNTVLKSVVGILLAICICRMVFKPKKYNVFAAWMVLELGMASLVLSKGGIGQRMLWSIRRYRGSLFGLTSAHQILVNFSGVDRLMSQAFRSLRSEPVHYTLLTRVFGAVDTPAFKEKTEKSFKGLLEPIERLFLNDAAAVAALEKARIPQKVASFATFSSDPKTMERWELSAEVQVATRLLPDDTRAVEANLYGLTRDFGACIAIPLLYGNDFLSRNRQLLDDLWKFDNDFFPLVMVGIPLWAPFKVMRDGRAARSRMISQLEGLYRRVDQHERGESVDFGADLSDVSSAVFGRSKVYNRDGWSFEERGAVDLQILVGQNVNTQPTLFWLLTFVYSTPGLLERLREEVSQHVRLSQRSPAEIMSMEFHGLSRDCQLLKACIFETYRLANEPNSLRYVEHPTTIVDGEFRHQLNPGMFLSVPHFLIQRDQSVYANPDKFIPERFLETDSESGRPIARYGRLRPWGSGVAMCKGRTFAEKQLVFLGAAIISLWNIAPASGAWELPDMTGSPQKRPVKDIRVLITRRTL